MNLNVLIVRKMPLFFLFVGVFLSTTLCYAAVNPIPVGTWKTIDDETGKARSIVLISATPDNQLQGKIQKVFYQAHEGPNDICYKCTGSFHNQLILGMTFLWGMTQQKEYVWSGGKILDPHNGKIYRCQLTLSPDGQKLAVRGYIGVPMLGRTQTWYRVAK